MKKVFVKYNPYKLETEIKVDGKHLAANSRLGEVSAKENRLQEWIEILPQILIDEYNDTDFEVLFHGTLLDFEDLSDVFATMQEKGSLTAMLERKPAKETSDKEVLIDEVWEAIQKGPFNELRADEITSAFELAKSSDFEVCVVATMSAGKSTLINAMLGTKLMPSKQEACTAIITRIKDVSEDDIPFQAEVCDKDGRVKETHTQLNYSIMERLNSDVDVSEIRVNGNIPFVSSEDVSLVLIDTPGPNNARDPRHKKVQSELLKKSSKPLILYIMTGEFGTDDDNTLLKSIAENMAVGGKQSKDRFIFVVNKLDDRKKEDGDTSQTLERVRLYLKTHGVANPNLFPAAALPALNIRLIENGAEIDEDTVDETDVKVRKLNRNNPLHFETYAALPPSIHGEIGTRLSEAQRTENANGEALIHSGIVSIEAAIRQYVQKYAKTAKIKNIVDTFTKKLDALDYFEKLIQEIRDSTVERDRIVSLIVTTNNKMDNAKEAKKFKGAVDDAVVEVNDKAKGVVEEIIQKFQERITKKIDELRGKELSVDKAYDEQRHLEKFAKQLDADFDDELDDLVRDNLVYTCNALLEEYEKKLEALAKEIGGVSGISIDPLNIMKGSFGEQTIKSTIKTKTIEDGYHMEDRPREPILGLGIRDKILGMKQERVTDYKTVTYVNGSELAQEFFRPMQQLLYDNGEMACKFTLKQSKKIAERFNAEFKRLDDILKAKLDELKSCATDQKKAEERIKESELKLKWLETIKAKVESILEI